MNKHTPGPWTVTKETRVQAGDITFRQEHSIGKTYEELDANARLIAAAPELLEVLADSLPVIDALSRGDKPDKWVMRNIAKHMADAIAKTVDERQPA